MASTMQLEFMQAMQDFKTMFPDMEGDVIEVTDWLWSKTDTS